MKLIDTIKEGRAYTHCDSDTNTAYSASEMMNRYSDWMQDDVTVRTEGNTAYIYIAGATSPLFSYQVTHQRKDGTVMEVNVWGIRTVDETEYYLFNTGKGSTEYRLPRKVVDEATLQRHQSRFDLWDCVASHMAEQGIMDKEQGLADFICHDADTTIATLSDQWLITDSDTIIGTSKGMWQEGYDTAAKLYHSDGVTSLHTVHATLLPYLRPEAAPFKQGFEQWLGEHSEEIVTTSGLVRVMK